MAGVDNMLLRQLAMERMARATVAQYSPVRRNDSVEVIVWECDDYDSDNSEGGMGETSADGGFVDSVLTPSTALDKIQTLLDFAGPKGAGLKGASVRYALCASMGNPDR